ncbi:ABC transporter ATP-binding protein [Aquamicrobium sp. LC103]|uniref:ABC transporter ATP-binding protein n=1 Tax=Aquamicrobium sp. LC103 TaxID=1120658 RepID=UPI00063EB9F0|nr:ABC transporter ATP-binding protein [Aquamicrobium sp. LC103]TKT69659.1 ABC transporter ATP-binding protein [Aquamicrobium sp. LC103]
MLQLEDVKLNYGSFRALDGINLSVREGELVVMLGANGAGKSSMFLAISGLRKLSGGKVRLAGTDITRASPNTIVSRGLVQCPEGRKLFASMSVERNLMLGGYVHRADKAGLKTRLEEIYEMFPILREKRDDHAGSLSGGQQQMVAIGRALMGRPKLLLLDEPSLGLAPLVVRQVLDTIKSINAGGTTVLLAEQNAYAALQIADRGYVMESGRVVLEGSREELLNNETVRRAYIGG